jgi:hypothetical protein
MESGQAPTASPHHGLRRAAGSIIHAAMKFLLPLLTALSLAAIHLLPEAGEMAHSAVEMDIPASLGSWNTRTIPPSEEEIAILASDTRFSKAICLSPRDGEFDLASGLAVPDRIDMSIVLSGHDLNNSIHRPERCMPAQGHVIGSSSDVEIPLPNGRTLTARRLLSVQSLPADESRTRYLSFNCVTYYFFIGNHSITNDHLQRTLIDMKDRLLRGMDQRWAYVSASMWYGKVPWIDHEVPESEADAKLRAFITEFAVDQIDWEMIAP